MNEYEYKGIVDQMNYEIFLAEEAMRISLRNLDRKAKLVTEAADIEMLNEAVVDVIKTYIKKVAQSIQKAWNNFKAKIDYKLIHFVIDNNKKYLESDFKMKLPDEFMYPEINEWTNINENCTIGDNMLNAGNYAQMSEYLESPEAFLKQYYQAFVEVENGEQLKLSEVFEKRCFSKADQNQVVDKVLISQYVEFLNDYNTQVQGIQADIDSINNINANIDQFLRQVVNASTVYIGDIIMEAEENTNKFRSADPNDQNNGGNNSKDRKNITTYYKAMTQILTAKMRTCNKVKSNALRIVTNFVRLQGGIVKIPKPGEKK